MEHNARDNRPRSVIHPAQHQPHQRTVYKLRDVAVHGSEYQRRDDNGHPVPPFAAHVQQSPQHGSAENHLLGHRRHKPDSDISQRFAHDILEQLFHSLGHGILYLLNSPLGRQNRTQCRHCHPEQYEPRLTAYPGARNRRPLAPCKQANAEHAEENAHRCQHFARQLRGLSQFVQHVKQRLSARPKPNNLYEIDEKQLYQKEHNNVENDV